MSLSDIAKAGPTGPQHAVGRKAYPDGWQPRSEIDDQDGGYVVTKPAPDGFNQSHEEALAEFGLSSEDWIVNNVRRSRWQKWDETYLNSTRLTLVPRRAGAAAQADFAEIAAMVKDWHPSKENFNGLQKASFVAPTGDTQIGKSEGGGTPETVKRILTEYGRGLNRFNILNERYKFEQVVLPQLGDCIEGFNSQGGAHVLRTDLGLTEMVRVYRRLLWTQIKTYAGEAPKVLIPIIPGNHDEALRINDKMATTSTDSWAIDAGSALYDSIQENDDLKDRVSFVFPEYDELTVAVDVSGTALGIAHGHQFGKDAFKWWDSQAALRSPIGDSDILLCGHLHHLRVQDHAGGRTFLQVPALDGGSNWFKHLKGQQSPSRAVTFWTSEGGIFDLDPIGRSV